VSSSYLIPERLSALEGWYMLGVPTCSRGEMLCWAGSGAQLGSWQGTREGMKNSGCPRWLASVWTLLLLSLQLKGDRGSSMGS